ncbi:unnamed protein product [Fusarium fujikuroi]|nr:unnamed protein product [Fusarium fujikuroi]
MLYRAPYIRYWIVKPARTCCGSRGSSRSRLREGSGGASVSTSIDSRLLKLIRSCKKELRKAAAKRRRKVEAPGGVNQESRRSVANTQGKRAEALEAGGPRCQRKAAGASRELPPVPDETLKWLGSIDATKPVMKPFRYKQEKRYLCYCARIWPLGRDKAQEEHGIRFTDEQWGYLADVIRQLDIVADNNKRREEDQRQGMRQPWRHDGNREAEADTDSDSDIAALNQAKLGRKQYYNPLLHFTAILGIKEDGNWVLAYLHTCFLAGFL